jgi:hypothetical protein
MSASLLKVEKMRAKVNKTIFNNSITTIHQENPSLMLPTTAKFFKSGGTFIEGFFEGLFAPFYLLIEKQLPKILFNITGGINDSQSNCNGVFAVASHIDYGLSGLFDRSV